MPKKKMKAFGRLITAMVTPFKADLTVDCQKVADLAKRLVEQGSDGLLVTGTTGESATLSHDEKLKLWTTVVDAVGDRVTVLAGTGTNSTESTVSLSREAEATGVHGLLLVNPYYNKPPQEGLYRHFRAAAEATRLPVMLYNIPSRTGVNLAPATVLRLASDVPNILGIKEASGSLDQVAEIVRGAPRDFAVLSGDDKLTLPMMAVGAQGVVAVASHLVGPAMDEMIKSFLEGNVRRATEIHLRLYPLFQGLFVTANPIPVKWALKYVGFDAGGVRPPLTEPTVAEEESIRDVLRETGLL